MYKLSIITINYNNSTGLERTIKSVINQNSNDFEYIVIDGASTDNSKEVIHKYENQISYWKSEEDTGIYNAMNKGILKASGNYCLFLNSGDKLNHDDVIEEIFLNNPTADIVSGNTLFEKSHLHEEQIISPPIQIKASDLVLGFLPHQSTLIKRNLFIEISFYNENYKISSDWSFFIQSILVYNKSYQKVNVLVSCCESTGISRIDANLDIMKKERISTIKLFLPQFVDDYLDYEKKIKILRSSHYQQYIALKDSLVLRLINAIRRRYLKYGLYKIKNYLKKRITFLKYYISDYKKKKSIDKLIQALPKNILTQSTSDLVISLTSYNQRLHNSAPYAIYSIFKQSLLPKKIILFVDEKKWNNNNLPKKIKRLQQSGLEVKFCEDIYSFTKLIPALKLYSQDKIVTVDDDIYYHENILKQLDNNYVNSNTIICHMAVAPEKSLGKYKPYSEWKNAHNTSKFSQISPLGIGGVLYPPKVFDDIIFDQSTFLKHCNSADDLWFWIIGLLSNAKYKLVSDSNFKFDYINNLEQLIPSSKALHFENVNNGRNNEQLNNLIKHFNL